MSLGNYNTSKIYNVAEAAEARKGSSFRAFAGIDQDQKRRNE